MKRETLPIVVFYVLYFTWVFVLTYLTPQTLLLNYFSFGVVLFYFLILREEGDFSWFIFSALIPLIITATSISSGMVKFNFSLIAYIPIWLPLAWGTTVVALRKFYNVMNSPR